MELTITKERLVEAAKTCSAAKKVLKTMFPEAFGETYKLGDFFVMGGLYHDQVYMLAQVEDSRIALICLRNGNRYIGPKSVENPGEITSEEVLKCASWSKTLYKLDVEDKEDLIHVLSKKPKKLVKL